MLSVRTFPVVGSVHNVYRARRTRFDFFFADNCKYLRGTLSIYFVSHVGFQLIVEARKIYQLAFLDHFYK